jgi:hypothetical protein
MTCVRFMVIREKIGNCDSCICVYCVELKYHIMKVNETNTVKLHAFSISASMFYLFVLYLQQETNGWEPFYGNGTHLV